MKIRELMDTLLDYDPDMEVGVIIEADGGGSVFLHLEGVGTTYTRTSDDMKIDLEFSETRYEEI